jgi:hypothetical protein
VSPILVRPVREQFEHDRVIRVLQARYKRKYEVVINPGAEQNASVSVGDLPMYPDLVLFSPERGKKLQATVEVETTESINTLEAMAEWGPLSRMRTAFFLYVPVNSVETARRLCSEHGIVPSEIWTYHSALDQIRFTMVHRAPESARPEGLVPKVTITRPATPLPSAEPRPAAVPAPVSGGNGSEARTAATRPAPEKAKSVKKAPARTVKTTKKVIAKKPPRAAAARPRAAAKAAKNAKRKTTSKRSVSPKR